ncbi:putative FBD-associated F-box protein At5g56560 [Salvia hispanica]|uniref:putative FBD-associated F-box protein At5g56560 n=1 Tax=Salvia hispanica TaxID=49212 RepID=UPI002009A41F|nr:putative FBD-associated F-box protein At5g56560 [Salvia hispanica]
MEEEEDRLSQLPDDILLLILDKIDIYEAVKTMSLVSHRWKNLWRSLPGLRFHFRPATTPFRIHLEDFSIHSSFVSHLLFHRDASSSVHDFHLSFDGPTPNPQYPCGVDREFLEECLLYALNHGLQSLRLHWPTYRKLRLPPAFLTCNTLRELEIRDLFCPVKLPGRLSLPNLKTLHLHTISLVFDHHHDPDPFSGLPQLEKLTLITFMCDGLVAINAPKLRFLEIEDDYLQVEEISAPLLTSFTYKSSDAWECAKVNLLVLEHVYLDIDEVFNKIRNNFVRMLHQLGNAATVSLTSNTLKILEREFGSFEQTPTPFPNMKCLKDFELRGGAFF